jgi:hypothetical protein
MTTFNWQIVQMDRLISNNFVVTCHYKVTATDGDYTSSNDGTLSFTQEEGATYIPYTDLTEAICIGWVQDNLRKETIEASLQSQINLLKNPIKESGVPWTI